jgi:hypothetical protein
VAITQLAGSEDCSTIGVGEHRPCVAGRPYNRQGTLSCRTAGAGNYVERDRILLRNGRSVASNGRPVPPRNLICVVDSWVDAWSVFLPTSIWPGKVGFAQSRRDLLSGFNAPANFYVTGRQRLRSEKLVVSFSFICRFGEPTRSGCSSGCPALRNLPTYGEFGRPSRL